MNRRAACVRPARPSKVASRWAEFSNQHSWEHQSKEIRSHVTLNNTDDSLRPRAGLHLRNSRATARAKSSQDGAAGHLAGPPMGRLANDYFVPIASACRSRGRRPDLGLAAGHRLPTPTRSNLNNAAAGRIGKSRLPSGSRFAGSARLVCSIDCSSRGRSSSRTLRRGRPRPVECPVSM